MKKFAFFVLVFVLAAVPAQAQVRFGLGLRAGASGHTHEVFADGIDTHVGPAGSGNVFCLVTDWLLVGVNAEGGFHSFKAAGEDFGKISTLSVIPFVELRGPANAYLSLGVGYNFNFFDLDNPYPLGAGIMRKLDLDDTIAFRIGGGWDFFINDNLAANVEIGWKYNKGDADAQLDVGGVTRQVKLADGFDASEVVGLVGLRYFF